MRIFEEADVPTIELDTGSIHYTEAGPRDGRPVVFVHGYLMAGSIWDEVTPRLAAQGLRCLAPTWPLGSHPEAMRSGADTSPRGVAGMIAAFLEALDLDDVVLVGSDTGGALCQVVAVDHPERLGALVLTNCDAFDNFPPSFFKVLKPIARIPGGLGAVLAPMRLAIVRRSPLAYGLLTHRDIDHLVREWVRPVTAEPGVLDDLRRFTIGLDPAITLDAAERLGGFDRPVLLAWALDDRMFPLRDAHRLADLLADARVETIAGSRALTMLDQPDHLAALIGDFARVRVAA